MTESINRPDDKYSNNIYKNNGHQSGFIDIHCHCIPGLDDGPKTQNEALELCRKMAHDGISLAIATPHQLGRYEGENHKPQILQATKELNELLRQNKIDITILPGGEVRIDERISSLLESGKVLTLADSGKYILLELPNNIFIDIDFLISELDSKGIKSVIAHAERIPHISHKKEVINRWIGNGALIQVSASSITGDAGLEYQRNAWQLLTSNFVSFIATDAHNTNSRPPQMTSAYNFISENMGHKKAKLLCFENPLRIINNQELAPVSQTNKQEAKR